MCSLLVYNFMLWSYFMFSQGQVVRVVPEQQKLISCIVLVVNLQQNGDWLLLIDIYKRCNIAQLHHI